MNAIKLFSLTLLIGNAIETLGYAITQMHLAVYRCFNCGTILDNNQVVCPRCGMNQITRKEER